ncbi:MAG: cell division protein ZapA [Acidimicrobiia bacterium]|nr:cell division protein ZapA [Acidimicrobiia bacterium]
MPEPRVITVDIAGRAYPIRSALDATYVTELASYVERKMRLATESSPSSDTVGVAVLAALNLADELFRARQQRSDTDDRLHDRARHLEQIVDDALALLPGAGTTGAP